MPETYTDVLLCSRISAAADRWGLQGDTVAADEYCEYNSNWRRKRETVNKAERNHLLQV